VACHKFNAVTIPEIVQLRADIDALILERVCGAPSSILHANSVEHTGADGAPMAFQRIEHVVVDPAHPNA
jgi:hypothetical protein